MAKKRTTPAKTSTEKQLLKTTALQKKVATKSFSQFAKAQKRYLARMEKVVSSHQDTQNLYNLFHNSRNSLTGLSRREFKRYHHDFIKEIEELVPSLESIVINPSKFIKETTENVQVEKAKRVSIRTVQYLAQNSQDVSDILDSGEVVPKRVLNVYTEDDLNIYENRFIMTLIKRLQIFIELRYQYIEEHGDTRNSDIITIQQKVKVMDATYEFEGKLKIMVPSDDEGYREVNQDLLNRLINLRKRISFLINSQFMKVMANMPFIQDPIQQTNIIRLNYLYNNAFKLWTYINRYNELGITYNVRESKVKFTQEYIDLINQLGLHSLFTLKTENARVSPNEVKKREVRPRISTALLDLDISDLRFTKTDLPFAVTLLKETPIQREARLKKERTRQLELARREALKEKRRLIALEKREKAKEAAKLRAEKAKERALAQKAAEVVRKAKIAEERKKRAAERARIIKERKDYENMLKNEALLLRQTREKVRKLAALKGEKR